MAREVKCVFFRANDGKRPGDVSRNMARIDAAVRECSAALMTDPRDSSLYLLAFPAGTAQETILRVTDALGGINDPLDNEQLLEAWPGTISAQALGLAGPQQALG